MIWLRRIAAAGLILSFVGLAKAGDAALKFLGGRKTIELFAADVLHAELGEDSQGDPMLDLEFTPEIGVALETNTSRWIGKKLVVKFGRKTLMRPVVRESITGGRIRISGPDRAALQDVYEALTHD